MTTDPAAIIARLNRLVMDADRSADEAVRELAAAMKDLDAAHRREASLAAQLTQAHKAIEEQAQVIAALQHAAVLSFRERQALCAEIARLRAERMGSIILLTAPITGGRN